MADRRQKRRLWLARAHAVLADNPFLEMMVNGSLDTGDLTGYTIQTLGTGTTEYLDGAIHLVGTDAANRGMIRQTITTFIVGKTYRLSFTRTLSSGNGTIGVSSSASATSANVLAFAVNGATSGNFVATATTLYFVSLPGGSGADYTVDNISVRRVL